MDEFDLWILLYLGKYKNFFFLPIDSSNSAFSFLKLNTSINIHVKLHKINFIRLLFSGVIWFSNESEYSSPYPCSVSLLFLSHQHRHSASFETFWGRIRNCRSYRCTDVLRSQLFSLKMCSCCPVYFDSNRKWLTDLGLWPRSDSSEPTCVSELCPLCCSWVRKACTETATRRILVAQRQDDLNVLVLLLMERLIGVLGCHSAL